MHGDWLDVGCAEGFYTVGLAERGAASVVGLEPRGELIEYARTLSDGDGVSFVTASAERLPFPDDTFDGVLLNEVLEHVDDDAATIREVERVLRPGGHLALFSPNRWFPFEGHGARLSETRVLMRNPVPLMPWLPRRLTNRVAVARNYWPRELAGIVECAHMEVLERTWALAQFDGYPWVPSQLARVYRRHLDAVETSAVARFLAVSTLIIARAYEQEAVA